MGGLYAQASRLNLANILRYLGEKTNASAKLLDLGCDDGAWTLKLIEKL